MRTCTYTTDIDEFFRHADARDEIFVPALPTSTTVEVRWLSNPTFLVEVEVFAMLPARCCRTAEAFDHWKRHDPALRMVVLEAGPRLPTDVFPERRGPYVKPYLVRRVIRVNSTSRTSFQN